MSTSKNLEDILDAHAEYYIRQTMKFFQENGKSPALSKNNKGDLEAKTAIVAMIKDSALTMTTVGSTDIKSSKHGDYWFNKGSKDTIDNIIKTLGGD